MILKSENIDYDDELFVNEKVIAGRLAITFFVSLYLLYLFCYLIFGVLPLRLTTVTRL